MLLVDGHLDLSMNALEWNRDLTRPLVEVRRRETGQTDKKDRGRNVCTFEEMRRGEIGLCIATQIARYVAEGNSLPGWHSPEIAWAMTQGQLAWYQTMEKRGELVQIRDRAGLARHLELWNTPPHDSPENPLPIGYVLSLEGADSIVDLSYLEVAFALGLRALGPAHYGPGRYSPGTGAAGGLTPAGRDLVKEMRRLQIILDVTHLTDEAFWEALDLYDGPLWASHNNCRALVAHQRQFNDDQLRELIHRDAIIGAAFDAWMMVPGWVRGQSTPHATGCKIETIVDHIDHICQLAGSSRHCAIGSDLDGGYGTEQTPLDLDSIADLQRLTGILARRSFSESDIAGIMHGNWIRKLSESLP